MNRNFKAELFGAIEELDSSFCCDGFELKNLKKQTNAIGLREKML
jgi:hypothetical protein